MSEELHHHTSRMRGRDPEEPHRTTTPLELLFDLTFVIAFGVAANELAHFEAADHLTAGVGGFVFAAFAVSWAWIQYSWFASAFDNDDWIYRLATMVQMVGVLLLALGLPTMFESLDQGDHVDNTVMVLGYVVMRVPMVFLWARAARHHPACRSNALTYILTLVVSQLGWVTIAFAEMSIAATFLAALVPLAIELGGPIVSERVLGGTPWHPHHIAERYGLLVIIVLGEGLIGTMATLSAIVGPHGPGWTWDVAVLGLAGTALTFGMWWMYFVVPSGELLRVHRERSFGWGYGHMLMFGPAVAVGAGLHTAAFLVEHHSELGVPGTVLTVAVPLAGYVLMLYVLYAALTRSLDPFHLLLLAGSAAVVAASILLANAGVDMVWCVAALALTPWVTVVGYELVGHRHNARVLEHLGDPTG
jgi:low temperature requirement protein LtrA